MVGGAGFCIAEISIFSSSQSRVPSTKEYRILNYLLIINFLDSLKVESIIVKYDNILGVQIRLECIPLEDGLKLLEQVQGMLCASDILEACVDESLQSCLELRNIDIELEEIAIECVAGVVEKICKYIQGHSKASHNHLNQHLRQGMVLLILFCKIVICTCSSIKI